MRKLPVEIATAMKKAGVTKQSKMRNKPETYRGILFASQAEAEYYRYLIQMKIVNEITWFIRQTPFHLPGRVKYIADFLVVKKDGSIEVIDVKGKDTAMSKLKRKQVEEIYGIKINVMRAIYRSGQITGFEEVEK